MKTHSGGSAFGRALAYLVSPVVQWARGLLVGAVERLLSRTSAPSLFDELDLTWRNLCLALSAAEEEIVERRYGVELTGGANKEANARLAQARLHGEKVRHEMLKFLDLLDQGATQ